MKVYSSHETYETENAVAGTVVDLNDGVFMFGVIESYNGLEVLEAFKEALTLSTLDDDFWFDTDVLDYAIVEIDDNNVSFYHVGGCEIYVKYEAIWYDLYDLIMEGMFGAEAEEPVSALGKSAQVDYSKVTEIILATSGCNISVEDLNDRVTEEQNFMTNLSFDEANDIRLVHVKVAE